VTSDLESLGAAQYALLTTYRRDGRAVPTPLWVVRDGDALAVWTPTNAGKVKRIRRSSRVLIGACDFRGNLEGPQVPGRARVLDAAGTARVRDLLARKYGLIGRLSLWGSRLRRGVNGTVGIQITL
jgi:PPOX class probable F420-dependent enzyme